MNLNNKPSRMQQPPDADNYYGTYQNKNHLVTKKKVPKALKKQYVRFQDLSAGAYFSARVLVDEAMMKNYIKSNKSRILRWIREPQPLQVQSVIRAFQGQQEILNSASKPVTGIELSVEQIKARLIDLTQAVQPKTNTQTRQGYLLDQNDATSNVESHKILIHKQAHSPEDRGSPSPNSGKISGAPNSPVGTSCEDLSPGINRPPADSTQSLTEGLTKNEFRVMRAFLLSSQLSVLVKTREVKCMIIKQQDKAYFSEQIKKIFDERSAELEFKDVDRPMKEVLEIERIRLDNHKWDLFKREYGEQVLKER